tara:strand:+ start:10775 stop:11215 length:441 start_codon:yes stop_codon:yes gene_type:complete
MKKQDFLNDVEHEVRMLKKYATKEELSNMDINWFNPVSSVSCIYGQMTGSCESKRAKILMDKSCVRVFNGDFDRLDNSTYSEIKDIVNGENESQGWNDAGTDGTSSYWNSRNYNHASLLEGYILMKDAKIPMIIKFLKGESNKLKL